MLKDFAIVPLLPPLLLSHHPRTGQLLRPPGNCDCAVQAMEGVSCISTLTVNPDTAMDKTLAELLHAETQDEVESQPEDSCTDNAACIFELELPESPKEMRKMQKDPAKWTVDKIKHGCEVRIEDLSNEEVEKFKEAKNVEVQNWIRDQACRAATGHIPKGRVMKMRWILTCKDTGQPKGRIVVLGYQDPDLEHLTRSSPTMTRRTRQLLLTYAAVRRWSALKGDVKGERFCKDRDLKKRERCMRGLWRS